MIRAVLISPVALLALTTAAAAQDMVIINATLVTGDGSEPVENSVVVVDDGKITYAGPQAKAGSFDTNIVIDVQGKWVTPGIFSSMTSLGLWDVSGVSEGNDAAAGTSRFSAALDVVPALNPASQRVAVSRAAGLTRASIYSSPAKSIFGGQGAIVDLGDDPDMLVQPRAFQMVTLGERGARIAGGSRTASFAELASALREGREIASGRRNAEDSHLSREDAQAVSAVLSGEHALYVSVNRASDIRAVLRLKQSYPKLRLVLVEVAEGWLVAEDIAAAGVPVITNPMSDLPDSFEALAATQSNVGRMVKAGVKVAIGALDGATDNQPRYATQFAGNLVGLQKVPGATGLSWGQAFAAISSVPAEIAGFGGKFGVLKPGAAGDVVIWDGDPLELSSAPVKVFIDGREQSLSSHQTRLRDRYRNLDESQLPMGYRR